MYYVIFDPTQQLKGSVLQLYELRGREYVTTSEHWLTHVELGLCLWEGVYEGKRNVWLRWCDQAGNVIPTGAERAEQERQAKEAALQQVEQERLRAERLAARLRSLNIDPDEL